MVQLSVVICSHNPRSQYLDRVLSALRLQSLPYEQWELLLVDNASQLALSARFDLSWHPNGRHVLENELGLAAARRRGMTDALSEVLIFVDDDNLLAENYLSEALRIGQEWPALGTWGAGTIIPEFERQPAGYLKPYLASLALRENTKAYWGNVLFCSNSTPCGAGMCVRAAVAKEYCRLQSSASIQITDRKGGMLVGHGDYEIAYVGCSLGFGMGVFPDLENHTSNSAGAGFRQIYSRAGSRKRNLWRLAGIQVDRRCATKSPFIKKHPFDDQECRPDWKPLPTTASFGANTGQDRSAARSRQRREQTVVLARDKPYQVALERLTHRPKFAAN